MRRGGIRNGLAWEPVFETSRRNPVSGCLLLAVIFGTLCFPCGYSADHEDHATRCGSGEKASPLLFARAVGEDSTIASREAGDQIAKRHTGKPHEIAIARAEVSTRLAERPLVVIDAGHGGRDPGAIGLSGMMEKTITLETAKELRSTLEKTGRYQVELTRTGDRLCPSRNAWLSPGSTTPTS